MHTCHVFPSRFRLSFSLLQVIPDCINLRILSNAVYFVGRARAGEDSIESLTTRADAYAKRVQWVRANADAIVDALREAITAKNA